MTPLYHIYIGALPAGIVFPDEDGYYRWADFLMIHVSEARFDDMASAKRDLVGFVEDKYNFKVR